MRMLEYTMAHMWDIKSIEDLENHIDNAFNNLKIYQLPLEIALIVSLTIFENKLQGVNRSDYDQFSAEAAIGNHRNGIQILIPQIFKQCTNLSHKQQNKTIVVTPEQAISAAQAIAFCQRYSIAIHTYTQYHQTWLNGKLNGRIAQFSYPDEIDFGRAQLNLMLHKYHERQTFSNSVEEGKIASLKNRHESVKAKLMAIQYKNIYDMLYTIPDEIYRYFHDFIEAAIAKPTLDAKTEYHGYTVDDYYRFWIELAALMMIYQRYCWEKHAKEASFNYLQNAVIQFKFAELTELLSKRNNFPLDLVEAILSDIILDTNDTKSDVLVQPLVPISHKKILVVAPTLITYSNWEVCLLRNWSRFPDIYGKIVASKKSKLAIQLADLFNVNRFIVSNRKKLYDDSNQITGDVDVAVFDPYEGLLVLFELKWLIEPDSIKETVRTQKEVSKGIEQLLKIKLAYESNSSNFLRYTFPDKNIELSEIKDVRYYVMCHGDVGIKDDKSNNIFVLDYILSSEIIAHSSSKSLRNILDEIIHKQNELLKPAEKFSGILKYKLAGFLFCQPGYGTQIDTTFQNKPEPERNAPCLCGSGLKYKKCCLEISHYSEHFI